MNPINLDNIPTELKQLEQWVCWKKADKCPVSPQTGNNAKSDKPETWGSFEQAVNRYESQKGDEYGGVGFVFSGDDPYVGIDGDRCREKNSTAIDPTVKTELQKLNTYCEFSPSGEGVHAIVKGKLPGDGLGPKEGRIFEMYDKGRYFTVTGLSLTEFAKDIETRDEEVKDLYRRMSGGGISVKTSVSSMLAGVPEGSRNGSCASIAGKYFYDGYETEEVLELCIAWNVKNSPPLDEREIISTVASIARKHARRQAEIEEMLFSAGLDHNVVIDCVYSNEDGDARIFQYLYNDRFIFDHGAALWNTWGGHYWREDETDESFKAVQGVISVYDHAAAIEKVKSDDQSLANDTRQKHFNNYETLKKRNFSLKSGHRKRSVLWVAGIGTGLTGREWDQDPWKLACENGVIDLKTGTLHPGKQTDYIKTPTDIIFDEAADCPRWTEFLNEIFDHDKDLINYVKRLFDYGITGLKQEHVLPVLWGAGRNGKGTFLETIKGVMGKLAHKTKAESLMDNGKLKASGTADADTIAFMGKRIIWASETNEGGRMNVGKIKELVGGDTLNARAPYARRSVEFEPSHLLCLITNAKPYAPASDFALWERVALIPFTLAFVDEPKAEHERKANKKLPEQLKDELPGILNWLVAGCLEWQQHGLFPPDKVKSATSKYQKENDLIGDFITECCDINPTAEAPAAKLYGAYKSWAESMGYKPISGVRFGKEVAGRFEKVVRRKRAFYTGVSLSINEGEGGESHRKDLTPSDFDVFDEKQG